jgi:hypothetical protein
MLRQISLWRRCAMNFILVSLNETMSNLRLRGLMGDAVLVVERLGEPGCQSVGELLRILGELGALGF